MLLSNSVGEIFISSNQSNNWINITENLIGSPVLSMYVFDDFIYAGLNAGGVWRYPLSDLVGINDNIIINNDVSFMQNCPNPFNPSTTISFSIPEESKIALLIYNLKGQKTKTLAHHDFTSGYHSIIWNGDDDSGKLVSSGIYFYKLIVNSKVISIKKCMLLK